jgi:hypothetical protein
VVLNNNPNIEEIEMELKYIASLGSDVSFYGFCDRKLQKGEFLYQHQTITLRKLMKGPKLIYAS